MKIDDRIFMDCLNGKDVSGHWLFHEISSGYVYREQVVDRTKINEYKKVYQCFKDVFRDFRLINQDVIEKLFPKYKEMLDEVHVLISIGFPEPYDCIYFEHQLKRYICFDMGRFLKYYQSRNGKIDDIIRQVITHEFIHYCAHADFLELRTFSYHEEIDFLIFHEGLAHLLAYQEGLNSIDLSEFEEDYNKSLQCLRDVYEESDTSKQQENIAKGTGGRYWNKFICVVGKFYFYQHRNRIEKVYHDGYVGLSEKILNQ